MLLSCVDKILTSIEKDQDTENKDSENQDAENQIGTKFSKKFVNKNCAL